jgi:hypothetical protein
MIRIEELYTEVIGKSMPDTIPPKVLEVINKHTLRHLKEKWELFSASFDDDHKDRVILDFMGGYAAGLVDSKLIKDAVAGEMASRKAAKAAAERN